MTFPKTASLPLPCCHPCFESVSFFSIAELRVGWGWRVGLRWTKCFVITKGGGWAAFLGWAGPEMEPGGQGTETRNRPWIIRGIGGKGGIERAERHFLDLIKLFPFVSSLFFFFISCSSFYRGSLPAGRAVCGFFLLLFLN